VLFILFGASVFLPLARRLAPADLEEYSNLEMPIWVLPFQALRGVPWAAALPAIRMMKGRWWETELAVALLFSVLMGANLLRPTGLPPRIAGSPLCGSVWRELCVWLDRGRAVVPPWHAARSGHGLRDATEL
jgi:hypothetical protein